MILFKNGGEVDYSYDMLPIFKVFKVVLRYVLTVV